MFATKEELAALSLNLNSVSTRVDALPTRAELDIRVKVDDEFRSETKRSLTVSGDKLDALPGTILSNVRTSVGIMVGLATVVLAVISYVLQHYKP